MSKRPYHTLHTANFPSEDQDEPSTPAAKRPRQTQPTPASADHEARCASQRRPETQGQRPHDIDESDLGDDEGPAPRIPRPEDFDEEYASIFERVRAVYDSREPGVVAEHGIIESIEAVQFMCHPHLKFDFDPRLNFLIGRNGSGKSAILSAITIALGGKTTSTGRGTGLRSFIREGKSAAEVTICLKNKGPEAYKHSTYGDKIQITRHFTIDGRSTWKIKAHDGKVVIECRQELTAICDYMDIQVDNPLTVLTQDASRQFLGKAGESEKYSLFLRSTLLKTLEEQYDAIEDNVTATSKILKAKRDGLPDLRQKVIATGNKLQEALRAQSQEEKLKEIAIELAWAHVKQKADARDAKKNNLTKLEDRLAQYKEAADINDQDLVVADAERDVRALAQTDELSANKQRLKEFRETKDREAQGIKDDMDQINGDVKECDARIKSFETQIETETRKHQERSQKDFQAVRNKSEKLQREMNTKKSSEQVKQLEQIARDKQGVVNDLQSGLKRAKDNLDAARRREKDPLAPYGHNMRRVLQGIEKMTWYGSPPVGPLGSFVKAREPEKWGPLLRNQLATVLTAFALTDARDQPQLKDLLHRTGNRHLRIIINDNDIFDFSHGEPPANMLTVLRALEVDDPYVLRVLINHSSIERVVLAETRRQAEHILTSLGGGQSWTLDPFLVRVYKDGVATTKLDLKALSGGLDLLLTRRDDADRVSFFANTVRQNQDALDTANEDYQVSRETLDTLHRSIESRTSEEEALRREIEEKDAENKRLSQELEDDLPIDLAALHHAKEQAIAEKQDYKEKFERISERHLDVQETIKDLTDQLKGIEQKLRDHDEHLNEAKNQLENAVIYLERLKREKQKMVEKQDEQKQKITDAQAIVADLEQELARWTGQASELGGRVENPGSIPELEQQRDAIQAALRDHRRRNPAPIEELSAAAENADNAYAGAKFALKQLLSLNKMLKYALEDRKAKWFQFRAFIALRCKAVFTLTLSQRGYFGRTEFNNEKGELHIRVRTDDQVRTQGNGGEKDPNSLSGGEKSFSTICLLLSLWESVGCPLRCLDEFDVFMDAINRRTAINMVIDTALASNNKQYILITPQDITNTDILDKDKFQHMKILNMPDPERRNTGRRSA